MRGMEYESVDGHRLASCPSEGDACDYCGSDYELFRFGLGWLCAECAGR